ncbi:MAG: hypothetical protein ACM3ON_08525 [Chloroflexota bacterium]
MSDTLFISNHRVKVISLLTQRSLREFYQTGYGHFQFLLTAVVVAGVFAGER